MWRGGVQRAPHRQTLPGGDKVRLCQASSAAPRVLSRGSLPPKTVARRAAPYTEWIGACQGGTAANCNFDCASLIAETALPGVVAERVAGRHLEWHPAAMRLPNSPEARALVNPPARAGWTIE